MIQFSEKTKLSVNYKEKWPVTVKLLKASLGHTINPALGHLLSNKNHFNLILQNTYVIKTQSTISGFWFFFQNLWASWLHPGRLQDGKRYDWLLLLNLMTDFCHPKVKLNPSMKIQSQPELHDKYSTNSLEKWFSVLFSHPWSQWNWALQGDVLGLQSLCSLTSLCGLKKVKLLFIPLNALER